ncbi:MAG TPA: dockerin type I domain-containing protein [bacterium]|nr:dockerin type I domain-containing protein [bacterium]HPR86385.1 dockerin type I domain-containing protein [bacterium]
MKRWQLVLWLVVLGTVPQVQAQTTYTDNFNRAALGSDWSVDASWYQIVSGALDNTLTVASWDYYAVYLPLFNPTEVSWTWAAGSDVEGDNSGGAILRYDLTTRSGYFILRRYGDLTLHPIVNGIIQRNATTIASVSPAQAYPKAGDIMKVVISTDASGHHFKLYINNKLDGTLTDAAKLYGNGTTLYCGIALYGQRNNNIDDFTVKGSVPTTPPETIAVTSPNGGEIWYSGSSHAVTWSSANLTNNVKVELSSNGGSSYTTLATVANTGSYAWTLPGTTSTTCRIRVSDATDNAPLDISDANFTIATPPDTVTVTAPNGGEDLYSGNAFTIRWTSTFTGGNVRIEYSTDGGTTFSSIIATTPNSGSYIWTVPAVSSALGRIRISEVTDGIPTDQSNANFTLHITPPDLAIVRPNGGDTWLFGAAQEIQWTGPDSTTMPFVNLYYSLDNGGTWDSIISGTRNDGAYTWTVPSVLTTQALIRVEDAADALKNDQSNAVFTITSLVLLQVKDNSGQPGSTGNKVAIHLNNQTNIRGLSFRVNDSPNLLTAMTVTPVGRAVNFSVTKVDNGTNVIIYLVSMAGSLITVGSAPIINISYDVSGSAPVGDYADLTLSDVTVADANSLPVVPALLDGKFYFVVKGDVNQDGNVTTLDLERAIQLLLKTGDPITPAELLSGDMDADGDFDLIDFMTIWEVIY